jgi:hypothetical protein
MSRGHSWRVERSLMAGREVTRGGSPVHHVNVVNLDFPW